MWESVSVLQVTCAVSEWGSYDKIIITIVPSCTGKYITRLLPFVLLLVLRTHNHTDDNKLVRSKIVRTRIPFSNITAQSLVERLVVRDSDYYKSDIFRFPTMVILIAIIMIHVFDALMHHGIVKWVTLFPCPAQLCISCSMGKGGERGIFLIT